MRPTPKPLVLLADSSLLFWRGGDRPLLQRVLALLEESPVRAAYLGASNADAPEYYALFTGAMALAGISRCRMIPSRPSDEDRAWLASAHVILLAGGEPLLGWETFQKNGVEPLLRARYREGAVLMGLSAGAMQLGARAWRENPPPGELALFPVLGFAPFLVGVHEAPDWPELKRAMHAAGPGARGLGIPLGGGALVHPDGTLEPVRHPVTVFHCEAGTLRQSLVTK